MCRSRVLLVTLVLLIAPLAAYAQQAGKVELLDRAYTVTEARGDGR